MTTQPNELPDNSLALVQRHSLTSLVAQAVEKMILSGQALPGTKLNEAAIAESLGVSRGPLREAFRTLEESGLIRQEKNRGAWVREIEVSEAAEIYEVRAGLEAMAGRLLVERRDEPESAERITTLRRLIADMGAVAGSGDADRYHALNLAFHDQLIAATGNATLQAVYGRLVKQLALFRRRNLANRTVLPQSLAEHAAIVERIVAGDAPGAAEALINHARGSMQRMQAQANNPPPEHS